jgi:hypothetical protein
MRLVVRLLLKKLFHESDEELTRRAGLEINVLMGTFHWWTPIP